MSWDVPIFEKGDIDVPSNYKHISIVPNLSKVLKYLIKHNNIFSSLGFMRGISTIIAVIVFDIDEGLEKEKCAELPLCDLSKMLPPTILYKNFIEKIPIVPIFIFSHVYNFQRCQVKT